MRWPPRTTGRARGARASHVFRGDGSIREPPFESGQSAVRRIERPVVAVRISRRRNDGAVWGHVLAGFRSAGLGSGRPWRRPVGVGRDRVDMAGVMAPARRARVVRPGPVAWSDAVHEITRDHRQDDEHPGHGERHQVHAPRLPARAVANNGFCPSFFARGDLGGWIACFICRCRCSGGSA